MTNKATNNLIGKATQGRRILNEGIKRDLMRLLAVVTDAENEPDFSEIEEIANKYRMYFDENGELKELR